LSFLLALIGTGSTTEDEVDDVVDFHLQHPAFWSNKKHDRWARGSRVVAKVVGARLIALTGTLDCLQPEYHPLVEKDQRWDWRYDMRWDSRPLARSLYPISGRHSMVRSEAPSPSLARISDVRIALYMDAIRTDKSTRCRECAVRVTAGGAAGVLCVRNGAF
jgi:hypothetical protein